MTKTYNVNIVGSLTNTYGVLSGFSTSNYATTPRSFTFSSYDWEFNIGFKTGDDISGDQNIVTPLMENNVDKDAINIWVNNSAISIYIYDNANDELIISGSLACSINTAYYIRCQYISGIYYIKYSSDGINYTDISTPVASALYIWETNQKWVFGLARGVNRPFLGSIDLNYCYLKINNAIVWQGATSTSQAGIKIQLRHDTAANWTSVNPVLLEGEVGIETDTKKQKIGDGSTPWNNLAYDLGSTALQRFNADGQPVAVDQLLTTSTAIGSYNIDISSYLPNDSYDYEIILNGEIYNSNSTYGQVWLGSSKSTTIIVSNAGTNKRLSTILTPLVVSTNREITMQIAGHAIEWQNVNNRRGLYLVSYRRLGTNS